MRNFTARVRTLNPNCSHDNNRKPRCVRVRSVTGLWPKRHQTARLESLGVLAGGVAHDFNNLLTGILGNASLALETVPLENPARHMMRDVVDASERASRLTQQLLAYAGKGRFVIEPLNLSTL